MTIENSGESLSRGSPWSPRRPLRDRDPAPRPERLRRDLQARRGLAPLVFRAVDLARELRDEGERRAGVLSGRLGGEPAFADALHNGVEERVWRERDQSQLAGR